MNLSRRALLRGRVRPTAPLVLDAARCLGRLGVVCTACADACGERALTVPPGQVPTLHAARCTGCGDCVPACPGAALSLDSPDPEPPCPP